MLCLVRPAPHPCHRTLPQPRRPWFPRSHRQSRRAFIVPRDSPSIRPLSRSHFAEAPGSPCCALSLALSRSLRMSGGLRPMLNPRGRTGRAEESSVVRPPDAFRYIVQRHLSSELRRRDWLNDGQTLPCRSRHLSPYRAPWPCISRVRGYSYWKQTPC